MRYQMVIQGDARSMTDYESMRALELRIGERLVGDELVDGHDAGSGEWNIFLEVPDPASTLARIAATLDDHGGLRVGVRQLGTSHYMALYPVDLATFRVR